MAPLAIEPGIEAEQDSHKCNEAEGSDEGKIGIDGIDNGNNREEGEYEIYLEL
jgi:hypothetical protein